MTQAPRDENFVPSLLLTSLMDPKVVFPATGNEVTGALLVDIAGGGGTTVTREAPSSGVVDGSNNVFTFAHLPVWVQKDVSVTSEDAGYSLSGTGPYTVTFDPLAPPTQWVYSFYNA